MKLSALKTDPKKTGGVWVEIAEGFRVKVKRSNSPEYREALARLGQDVSFSIRKGFDASKRTNAILARAMAETIIVDWEGLEDDNGQPIPFSVSAAEKAFTDYPDLMEWVAEISEDHARFRADRIEAAVGNSARPSGGASESDDSARPSKA